MHLRITNSSTQAFDAFRFVFGSAGALELFDESGQDAAPQPIENKADSNVESAAAPVIGLWPQRVEKRL